MFITISFRANSAPCNIKPCVHDQRTWTKILIQEICNQLTCSFYRKVTILLAKHFLNQNLDPSSLIVDINQNRRNGTRESGYNSLPRFRVPHFRASCNGILKAMLEIGLYYRLNTNIFICIYLYIGCTEL